MSKYHYTWMELTDKYKRYAIEREDAPRRIRDKVEGLYDDPEWNGASTGQMHDYIIKGYEFPDIDPDLLPDAGEGEGGRWYFTDDPDGAEYQWDLDEMGEMDYYLKRKQVKSKPGIKLQIDMGFNSGINHSVIDQYGSWVGSLIATLEDNNYDLEIDLYSKNKNLIGGEPETEIEVQVSKFGELVFFKDWNAIFAPGGYRHLNHLAKCLPSEQGKRVADNLGYPMTKGYNVQWDTENRTLVITCGKDAIFPAALMNEALAKAKEEMD